MKYNLDIDVLEEIRELLIHGIDERRWLSIEESLELLNEQLGYDEDGERSEEFDDEEE